MFDLLRKHWLFVLPLLMFAAYYLPQNLIGFARYPLEPVLTLFIALLASSVSFILAYRWLPVAWADRLAATLNLPRRPDLLMALIVILYLLTLWAVCSAAERVPLLASLQGASAEQLADYRNTFMRGQTGNAGLVNYSFAILSQALMPLLIAHAWWEGKRWRHLVLALFILGTSLSLSKAAFLCVSVPLMGVWLMRGNWKNLAATVLAFVLSVAMMYVLASGRIAALYPAEAPMNTPMTLMPVAVVEADGPAPLRPLGAALRPLEHWLAVMRVQQQKQVVKKPPALLSDVPEHYSLFGRESQLALIANRIAWIPYVTAVDWFRYQQEILEGDYVLGRSIRPLAWMLGLEQIHLEREVAELQWGGPSGATSNAVFFADAWLNWGVFGVVLYSMLLALTIKLITTSGNPPLVAASAFPVWITCFSSLPPVYLSAGLGLLLLFALLARKPMAEAVP
ncbi:MAG TPA: hypothetical protein DIT18_03575 [Pseudomonas sp.]|nr:hypothetical protein [Pseudomonas sp.]